jgi:putative membrane protein
VFERSEELAMKKHFIWAGLALQVCAVPVLAQSTPATTPSTPPVTTPPPPAVHQPTGGPDTPPLAEPANAIKNGPADKGVSTLDTKSAVTPGATGVVTPADSGVVMPADSGVVTPGANSFTEAQARNRLQANGYSGISALAKDRDGIWRGAATKNGASVHVSVDYQGHIASN